ncbi:LysR family transcriptional regulator [Chitinimonas sp. PSY-7]|uniref:LysR substrate-binding domain-containing protein n=1 Tax=Chitinimonas sp. PSY-7 TaxID=3459088 RepID=UPI00403FEE91
MDRFRAMQTFVRVAELGSFVRAADTLGLSKASVSLIVSELERELGARLIQRTTRKLSLTEAGQTYLARCQDILEAVVDAENLLSEKQDQARGVLRAYAPLGFAQHHLTPVLPAYRAAFPDVAVELVLGTRSIDLVEEGFDLALIFGHEKMASSLVARKLAFSEMILCAAPQYLARSGVPERPADLTKHAILQSNNNKNLDRLFRGENEAVAVTWPTPALSCNALEVLRACALNGMGIALLPSYVASESLREGTLVRVLPEWRAGQFDLYMVYPSRRFLSVKVRAAADFIIERFQTFAADPSRDPWLNYQPLK